MNKLFETSTFNTPIGGRTKAVVYDIYGDKTKVYRIEVVNQNDNSELNQKIIHLAKWGDEVFDQILNIKSLIRALDVVRINLPHLIYPMDLKGPLKAALFCSEFDLVNAVIRAETDTLQSQIRQILNSQARR